MIAQLWQSQPRVAAELTSAHGGEFSGPTFWFAVIALLTIAGAISTITRRNNIAAVMSLVATFFGLAAIYAMLSAQFIAVLQVLVYAGAIMTLFVFVIMVLNRDEAEPWAWSGLGAKALGIGGITYAAAVMGFHVMTVTPAHPAAPPAEFGTVEQVGQILFTDYLFVFEAVSILLLIAVVAAVVVARARNIQGESSDVPSAETDDDDHAEHHA
jgi:NADH-quinone oxidoreductase subunit J